MAGGRSSIYRDAQRFKADIVGAEGAAISFVECKAAGTVTPPAALPMRRLAEAFIRERPHGAAARMTLVYQATETPWVTVALARGVRGFAWPEFVRTLCLMFSRKTRHRGPSGAHGATIKCAAAHFIVAELP